LPTLDAGLRLGAPPHDLAGAEPLGRQQHDLGSLDVFLLSVAVPDECLKEPELDRRDGD
jgi:hypothetical protein